MPTQQNQSQSGIESQNTTKREEKKRGNTNRTEKRGVVLMTGYKTSH